MIDMNKLKLGQKVTVRTWSGSHQTGVIDEIAMVDDDNPDGIKNGRPGIGYTTSEGGFWCYQNQIVSVA